MRWRMPNGSNRPHNKTADSALITQMVVELSHTLPLLTRLRAILIIRVYITARGTRPGTDAVDSTPLTTLRNYGMGARTRKR